MDILICWNIISILTAIFYIKLVKAVDKSKRSIRSSAQSRNFAIAIRLSLILITNLIAWLPIYVLSAVSLKDGKLNIFSLQFAIILSIPLNSAINPYIYTTTGTVCFSRLIDFINNTPFSLVSMSQNATVVNWKNTSKNQVSKNEAIPTQFSIDEIKTNAEANNLTFSEIL